MLECIYLTSTVAECYVQANRPSFINLLNIVIDIILLINKTEH